MPVQFVCECGKKISVGENLIGKRVKCPACQKVQTVPDDGDEGGPDDRENGGGAKPIVKKKSKTLLYVGLGAGVLLLSCCCLGGVGGVAWFVMMVPTDKALAGTFPIEEKGSWKSAVRTTEIVNPAHVKGKGKAVYQGYKVRLAANTTYLIQLNQNGGTSDPYLQLEDPDGKLVADDDDSGGFPNAKIVYTAQKDGDYRIKAATLHGTGDFVLKIQESGKKGADNKGGDNKGASGKTILDEKGQWTKQDPKLDPKLGPFQSPSKSYKVNFKAGKIYTIDLVTIDKGPDPYLYLTDSANKMLAFDDDGGGYPNARITHTAAQDGEYRIVATTLNQGIGNFSLTVTEK